MDIDEELRCPICFERFSSPRSLNNCLHTFCEECIFQTFVSYEKKHVYCTAFPCPICRKTIEGPPSYSKVTKDWIKTFPLNHVVNSLLHIAVQDDGCDPHCEPCSNLNKTSEAVNFCIDCQEFMCNPCCQLHKNFKATKIHSLISVNDLKTDKKRALDLSKFLQCQLHKDKHVELFCVDDKMPVCVICIATNHRKCKNVVELKGHAESSDAVEKSKQRQDSLKNIQETLTSHISQMQQNEVDLKVQESEIINAIEKKRSNVISALNLYESTVLQEFKTIRDKKLERLNEDLLKSRRLLSSVKSSCITFDTVMKYGSRAHTFATLIRMQNQFEQYESLMKKEYSEINNEKVALVDRYQLSCFLNAKSLGYAELQTYTPTVSHSTEVEVEALFQPPNSKPEISGFDFQSTKISQAATVSRSNVGPTPIESSSGNKPSSVTSNGNGGDKGTAHRVGVRNVVVPGPELSAINKIASVITKEAVQQEVSRRKITKVARRIAPKAFRPQTTQSPWNFVPKVSTETRSACRTDTSDTCGSSSELPCLASSFSQLSLSTSVRSSGTGQSVAGHNGLKTDAYKTKTTSSKTEIVSKVRYVNHLNTGTVAQSVSPWASTSTAPFATSQIVPPSGLIAATTGTAAVTTTASLIPGPLFSSGFSLSKASDAPLWGSTAASTSSAAVTTTSCFSGPVFSLGLGLSKASDAALTGSIATSTSSSAVTKTVSLFSLPVFSLGVGLNKSCDAALLGSKAASTSSAALITTASLFSRPVFSPCLGLSKACDATLSKSTAASTSYAAVTRASLFSRPVFSPGFGISLTSDAILSGSTAASTSFVAVTTTESSFSGPFLSPGLGLSKGGHTALSRSTATSTSTVAVTTMASSLFSQPIFSSGLGVSKAFDAASSGSSVASPFTPSLATSTSLYSRQFQPVTGTSSMGSLSLFSFQPRQSIVVRFSNASDAVPSGLSMTRSCTENCKASSAADGLFTTSVVPRIPSIPQLIQKSIPDVSFASKQTAVTQNYPVFCFASQEIPKHVFTWTSTTTQISTPPIVPKALQTCASDRSQFSRPLFAHASTVTSTNGFPASTETTEADIARQNSRANMGFSQCMTLSSFSVTDSQTDSLAVSSFQTIVHASVPLSTSVQSTAISLLQPVSEENSASTTSMLSSKSEQVTTGTLSLFQFSKSFSPLPFKASEMSLPASSPQPHAVKTTTPLSENSILKSLQQSKQVRPSVSSEPGILALPHSASTDRARVTVSADMTLPAELITPWCDTSSKEVNYEHQAKKKKNFMNETLQVTSSKSGNFPDKATSAQHVSSSTKISPSKRLTVRRMTSRRIHHQLTTATTEGTGCSAFNLSVPEINFITSTQSFGNINSCESKLLGVSKPDDSVTEVFEHGTDHLDILQSELEENQTLVTEVKETQFTVPTEQIDNNMDGEKIPAEEIKEYNSELDSDETCIKLGEIQEGNNSDVKSQKNNSLVHYEMCITRDQTKDKQDPTVVDEKKKEDAQSAEAVNRRISKSQDSAKTCLTPRQTPEKQEKLIDCDNPDREGQDDNGETGEHPNSKSDHFESNMMTKEVLEKQEGLYLHEISDGMTQNLKTEKEDTNSTIDPKESIDQQKPNILLEASGENALSVTTENREIDNNSKGKLDPVTGYQTLQETLEKSELNIVCGTSDKQAEDKTEEWKASNDPQNKASLYTSTLCTTHRAYLEKQKPDTCTMYKISEDVFQNLNMGDEKVREVTITKPDPASDCIPLTEIVEYQVPRCMPGEKIRDMNIVDGDGDNGLNNELDLKERTCNILGEITGELESNVGCQASGGEFQTAMSEKQETGENYLSDVIQQGDVPIENVCEKMCTSEN